MGNPHSKRARRRARSRAQRRLFWLLRQIEWDDTLEQLAHKAYPYEVTIKLVPKENSDG